MPIEPLPGRRRSRTLSESIGMLARHLDAPTGSWVERLPGAWPELVGGRLARVSVPAAGPSGRLVVTVTEPVVAEQFRLLGGDLVAAVNRWAEADVVTELQVRVERPDSGPAQW